MIDGMTIEDYADENDRLHEAIELCHEMMTVLCEGRDCSECKVRGKCDRESHLCEVLRI